MPSLFHLSTYIHIYIAYLLCSDFDVAVMRWLFHCFVFIVVIVLRNDCFVVVVPI